MNNQQANQDDRNRAGWHMMSRFAAALLCLALLLAMPAAAQTTASGAPGKSSTTTSPTDQPAEKQLGDYIVSQSIELGYRITDIGTSHLGATDPGSIRMYDTLVDLHQGPRLLSQTLTLRSPEHNGVLFDDMTLSSFGWGGDPENVARLRMSKAKAYNFTFSFRRDRNFWDYDLLANPFNPAGSPVFVTFSPHRFETVRRMTDAYLTIAPQSKISVRLGYSRNVNEGPSWSTYHEGNDVLLFQPFRATSNSYQIGIDFKPGARTVISYDQFYQMYKGETSWADTSFPWVLSNGTPADLGLPFYAAARYPCATPFLPAAPVVNPACSVFLAYNRQNPIRTHIPTEQLSIHSNAVRKVDFIGRVVYSQSSMGATFNDFFNGLISRTSERQFTTFGPESARRVAVTVDLGVTVHITDNLRLSDSFRFYRYNIPTAYTQNSAAWTGATSLDPITALPSSTDLNLIANFLGENTKMNLVQLEYDFNKYLGGYIGYRFQRSFYDQRAGVFNVPTGSLDFGEDQVPVDSHSGLVGIYFRPTKEFRLNLDATLMNADNYLTRVSPRRAWEYRARLSYRPRTWASFAAYGTAWEPRNGIADIQYNGHTRNAGMDLTLTHEQIGFNLSYNYNTVAANSFICFNTAVSPPNPTTVIPGSFGVCPVIPEGSQSPYQTYQFYHYTDHYGAASISVKPVKRVGINLGYNVMSTNGNFTQLNSAVPFGMLKSIYHQPLASLDVELVKGVSGFYRWNYYDYNETTPFFGLTSPRDFHANLHTLGIRYAF